MVITIEGRSVARGAAIVLAGYVIWMALSRGLGQVPLLAGTAALETLLYLLAGALGMAVPICAGHQSAYMVEHNPKIHAMLSALAGAVLILGVMSAFVPDYMGARAIAFWLGWAAMFGWLGGILHAIQAGAR